MTKKVLLFACFLLSIAAFSQKAQKIGYIDMQYILENVPEYTEAQAKINAKALSWQNAIDKEQKEIDNLKAELNNERALLTSELIEERIEDIEIRELDLKKLQETYFGAEGDLYFLRQQLVKPIQDLVYNAIQDIATKRKYDFVLDKSSDLIMLYTNNQFDISEMVLASINKSKKIEEIREKQNNLKKGTEIEVEELTTENNEVDSLAVKTVDKLSNREIKKAELQKKIADRKAEQLKKREELKKAIEAKRQKRIQEIEDAKKAKEEQEKNKENN